MSSISDETDHLWNLTSIASLVIRNPTRTIQAVIPYLAMIGVFGAFVVWNGGVVLGKLYDPIDEDEEC